MPNFKPKPNKKNKYNKKQNITLDIKHKEFLNEFNTNDNDIIPNLKKQRNEFREKIKKNGNMSIEQKLDLEDKIHDLTVQIKELKYKKKDYFLENSKFIFEYFENKKNIPNANNTTSVASVASAGVSSSLAVSETQKQSQPTVANSKNKIINSFFKINTEITETDNIIEKENNIVSKYLSNIDHNFIDINSIVFQTDICSKCRKGELIPVEDEGILVCNNCFIMQPYLIENEKPSYKEPPKEVCFYAYKRINHFKEILAQFQGKETTQIPPEVIENIKIQIKKERIEISQISNLKTKEILKKLGYNKYYEHIPFIKDKMGIKPPIMSVELEETLCNLFIELQSPYSKNCPNYRVNFLNYYYTAYKLCELLGETQYLEHLPMLKDKEKRIEQDEIWKLICKELNWEFIPTI